jgi:hypothetical protein
MKKLLFQCQNVSQCQIGTLKGPIDLLKEREMSNVGVVKTMCLLFYFFQWTEKETCGPTPFFLLLYFLFPSQVNQRCNHLLLLWVSCKRNIIYLHHIASISWTCSPRKKNASPFFLAPHLNVIFTSTPFCLNRYQYGAGIRSQGSSIQHYCCKGKEDMTFVC